MTTKHMPALDDESNEDVIEVPGAFGNSCECGNWKYAEASYCDDCIGRYGEGDE